MSDPMTPTDLTALQRLAHRYRNGPQATLTQGEYEALTRAIAALAAPAPVPPPPVEECSAICHVWPAEGVDWTPSDGARCACGREVWRKEA